MLFIKKKRHAWTRNQTSYVKNHLFKFATYYMNILSFIASGGIYEAVKFYSLSLENDEMELSERCVKRLSLISIIRCY